MQQADVVVFNGGEDLHPRLYKETIIPQANVHWLDEERDALEVKAYEMAHAMGKFKFGICRGGQLLNVMNGGRLWQDVNNHESAHDMIDVETGETIYTSSVHHQQFILGPDATKVAVANISTQKIGFVNGMPAVFNPQLALNENSKTMKELIDDPEVVFYSKDRALCIQGHPEYSGYSQFTRYCFGLIERFI